MNAIVPAAPQHHTEPAGTFGAEWSVYGDLRVTLPQSGNSECFGVFDADVWGGYAVVLMDDCYGVGEVPAIKVPHGVFDAEDEALWAEHGAIPVAFYEGCASEAEALQAFALDTFGVTAA